MRAKPSKRILVRAVTLLLLFAVGGLSTVAKQSKYLPKSNPLRHFSKSAKMEAIHHPVYFVPAPMSPVAKIVPPRPEFPAAPLVQSKQLTLRQAGLTVSYLHRAPPV